MPTKLIELSDGTLIEVEAAPNEIVPTSSRNADRVQRTAEQTMQRIQPLIVEACRPVVAAWRELQQDLIVEAAELELGLSFEGEGNLYITKARATANLVVKLKLRPADSVSSDA